MFFELPFLLGSISILVLVFRADVHVVYWVSLGSEVVVFIRFHVFSKPRQASVALFECLVVILIVIFSDWPAYARKAQERNRLTVARKKVKPCRNHRNPTLLGSSMLFSMGF